MASLEVLIDKCEDLKRQIILLSKEDKSGYDEDLFLILLWDLLTNIMLCMRQTPSIPSGNRFNNWWRLIWDRCAIYPEVHNWANYSLSTTIYDNMKQETVTWKLKYLALTLVYFTKIDLSRSSRYLHVLISHIIQSSNFSIQLTYYQVMLSLLDAHRTANYDFLLNIMKTKLGGISDVGIIDPILHDMDTDQYCRTVLNNINRNSKQLVIYSIQCAEANLVYTRLLSPLKSGKLWIDFNLNAESITILCQRSCLRIEQPSIDSEEFDEYTTEILTIDFLDIIKIIAKPWRPHKYPIGQLLTFMLNTPPKYMYDSSCATVEQSSKLLLNIEDSDELNRLMVLLPEIFTTRFEIIPTNPERKVSQHNSSQNGQSNLSLSPYASRPVSVTSMMSHDSNLELDTSPQVSVAHKEMLSLRRSGSTIQSICQVQTTIHTFVNTDNWSASTSRNVLNPNKSRFSLTANNDDDDSVIESSQENKPSTISSLQQRLDRTMDKFNPEPYNPYTSNSTLTSMYNARFDNSAYKENQPVNSSQHRPSSATNVMNNSLPKQLRNQPERGTDMTSLPTHSRSEQPFNQNKSNGNGPSQVNDRLKDILVESDYDNESVVSDRSDKSMIISGSLRNRTNIGRSLLKSSSLKQDSQNSPKNLSTKMSGNRNSKTVPANQVPELLPLEQSQGSQETVSTDNWSASTSKNVLNPNKSSFSLTANNDDDDSVIESSQENKPSTISSLQQRLDRTMDKFNPEPYNPYTSNSTLTSMYNARFDNSAYKENQPVNSSQHRPSSATNVMNNSLPKQLRNQPERGTDMTSLPTHSRSEQSFNRNKSNGNGPSQVNDRLKDILVESDYDNESVVSDRSDKSMIISGSLRNRTNIGRSLLKSSSLKQDSQNSPKNLLTKMSGNRNSKTVSANRVPELLPLEQSQGSQETVSSGVEFQPRSSMFKFGKPNKASCQNLPEKIVSQKSQESSSSNIDFQPRGTKRNNPFQYWKSLSQKQKPQLDKSSNLPANDFRELFKRNNSKGTAEAILESALDNRELPKKLKRTTQNTGVNEPASLSSSPCDVLPSSQKLRTPEAVNKKPFNQWSLSVRTPETDLTNEVRDNLRSSQHYYLPETPGYNTPLSEMSARSQVSVPASICTDSQGDTVRDDDDDQSGVLVIDLDTESPNINDKPDIEETINAPVTVQPTTQRKRGRPSKASKASVPNTDYASDCANSPSCSLNSTMKSKRRQKKRKNKCDGDSDPEDEVNYTAELPPAQKEDEELERKRRLRFSTRSRFTKPPARYSDELNQSYLKSVKGEIRRKRESGYLTDTVVCQKRPSRRLRPADTTLSHLSQTFDADPSNYRYEPEFDSVIVERGTQSDVEVGQKHKKKKTKKDKRTRTEYDSSLINKDENIRLRLSRRSSTCELLTQGSGSHGETLKYPESQESQGWGSIFTKLPVPRKTNDATLNGAGPIDEAETNIYDLFKDVVAQNKLFKTAINEKHICKTEEQKEAIQLLYAEADSFMTPQEIKTALKENFETFLPSD